MRNFLKGSDFWLYITWDCKVPIFRPDKSIEEWTSCCEDRASNNHQNHLLVSQQLKPINWYRIVGVMTLLRNSEICLPSAIEAIHNISSYVNFTISNNEI